MNHGAPQESPLPPSPVDVTLLSVTYGQRWHLLRQCISSAFGQGVSSAIVLDNGSQQNIAELAAQEFGARVTVHRFERNAGSAAGFAEVLRRAHDAGHPWLLLMDDDNVLSDGGLATLAQAYGQLLKQHAPADLAVTAYRERHLDQAKGIPSLGMYGASGSSFVGFHVGDIPVKLLRRTALGRWIEGKLSIPPLRQIPSAPYSGMLMHRSVLSKHGYPDPRFLLYIDDTEFSHRLTRGHGALYLVTDAKLQDVELSWHREKTYQDAFESYLDGAGDFRVYYNTRNSVFYEKHILGGIGWLRWINRRLFLAILRRKAIKLGKLPRYALMLRAIEHGHAAQMGEHPEFRLP